MEGITVIDTIEIYELAGWQIVLGILPLILSAAICFIRMYKAFKKGTVEDRAAGVLSSEHWKPREILIVFLGGILSFVLMFCLEQFCPADLTATHYEVAVSDSVPFNSFYDTYEIIEKRDTTYIVKERLD